MNLLIIHLSDIHLKTSNDSILKRAESITAAMRPYLPNTTVVVIVVSGDIAQSGSATEYKIANRLLTDIRSRLKGETSAPIHFVLAPGNHDCDFRGDQATRQLVVEAMLKHTGTLPDSYLKTAVKVQSDFFSFRKSLESKDKLIQEDKLWNSYEFSVDGFRITFDALNASWMSTRHEQQGGLLFPFERHARQPEAADLRVCVLHHPLNWYSQSNYREFRSFLHQRSDFILTGHEHQAAQREIDDAADGQCIYLEGEALQTSDAAQSGFNILLVDTKARQYRCETLRLHSGRYEPLASANWEEFRPVAKRKLAKLAFTDTFEKALKDPGATLKHFSGRELLLDDIYVYPDLDERSTKSNNAEKARAPRLSASSLAKPDKMHRDVVIQGDDESGKTKLLFKLAREYQGQGYVPLILRGERLKSATPAALVSEIDSAVTLQYGLESKIAFSQLSKSEKIVLLDDFDCSPLNGERRAAILSELRERFGRTLLTVGENFEVAEVLGGQDMLSLVDMQHVKLLPLGNAKRLELIRKWNRIGVGESLSENQFLKSCDDAEKLIESTKLRFVASTSPIFVLSLLQATASGITSEIHNSSFAHYYYFLIIGALEKAKVSKQDLNTILSACTHLSWYIRKHGDEQRISSSQFTEFVVQYSVNWTATDGTWLLRALIDARLMEDDGGSLAFTYPYSYYYFLGKFASISQEKTEVQEYLKHCLEHLYARECANTLLFLAHHSGNSAVLESITATIDSHFIGQEPASLEKEDIASIASLLSQAPALQYHQVSPREFRQKQAESSDQNADESDGLQDKPHTAERDLFQEIVSLSKAIEISGTLLTHQFSNYGRQTKNRAIKSMFDGAMRAVKVFHSHFENMDDLLRSISSKFKDRKDGLNSDQAELHFRHAIAFLIKIVTTSFVMRASMSLRAKDLDDNISRVVQDNPNCANRLIKIAQELQNPSRLPRLEIDRLRKEEESNPAVMGVLQMLILQRLYMYETDHDDKDWAMSIFALGANRSSIAMKHRTFGPKQLRN